jgi:chromosome segregation protein
MEDVIFAGTENRKPLGYAYVAITLDNSDHQLSIEYEEVTVSRRLFRSGESEYRINGAICRLKDINELFYDTGIGKEGYSIIGQGQIDRILSGKADERRELFDEAAGIVKFKRRKAETIKKLENEKQNLVRVTDILSELEKQVKPLERQSENARQYLKLREQLKEYDINTFLMEVGRINEELSKISQNAEIANADLAESSGKLEEIKKTYEKLELYIEELNSEIEDKKNSLNQVNILKEKFDGETRVLNEQISAAKANETHYEERIHTIEESILERGREKEELLKKRSELSEMSGNAQDIQSEADAKYQAVADNIRKLSGQIEQGKAEIIRLLNEETNVKTKIQRYDTMLEQVNIRRAEISQRMLKFQSDHEAQEKVIQGLEEELAKITDEVSVNETRKQELSSSLKTLNGDLENDRKQQNINLSQYHKLNSNLESLKNITERYEGYGNSIKRIMELKETKKGIIGVVADIIKTEKKYEVAIETALGGNIQNIVTDTETTAKDAIAYLKKNKYGRATFLPLNSIANKTGFQDEQVFSEKGVIGLACDLIRIQKEYENIGKYLLGRIVVADTIDNALALARKYHYSLRIVTLEGELLNAGGSLSGGAFKNSSNLLGRRREIEDLETNVAKLKQEAAKIAENIRLHEEEVTKQRAELTKLEARLNEQYLQQNTAKLNLAKANEKKKELTDTYQGFHKETTDIAGQIQEIKNNHATLSEELNHWEQKKKQTEDEIENLSGTLEQERLKEAEESKKNEQLRLNLSGITQQMGFLDENIARIDGETDKLQEEKLAAENAQRDAKQTCEERKKQIEDIRRATKEASEQAEQYISEIKKNQELRDEQSKDHKEFFTKREELVNHIAELDKEVFRLDSQSQKLEEDKEKQVNYMWEEYEITYGAAKELRNEEYQSLPALKKEAAAVRNSIRALGSVNVNAIEEYQEVSERYEFLKTQHDDLTTAAENLEQIILELDTGMRTQFQEKFADIRREFDKVFKILFGGGKGSIELGESEDILEAEITIISQPPGKKLQNMMQLSGGEKALTAIALLFAIQNLKPSPFCLLDEIEAALDDSNVDRYAQYLHKLTDHTQFIVITHRRGTMNAADRLYGITMQEKGISTLVSVNLIQEELEKAEKAKEE